MDGILQKSMDINVELFATGKNSNARSGPVMACLRAERVSSIPVDNDNKNNNNVLLAGKKERNIYQHSDTIKKIDLLFLVWYNCILLY